MCGIDFGSPFFVNIIHIFRPCTCTLGCRRWIVQPHLHSSSLLLRGSEQATSASQLLTVQPHRGQQSSATVVVPKVGGAKAVSDAGVGGKLNSAAEFAVTKLDDLVNWGRRVRKYREGEGERGGWEEREGEGERERRRIYIIAVYSGKS